MLKKPVALFGALLTAAVLYGATNVYNDYVVNEPALAYSKTHQIDLATAGSRGLNIDEFSAQAVYSSATIAAVDFTDGRVSTGSITVDSLDNLLGAPATNQITVTSTATLKNGVITINGKKLRNGYSWFTKASTALTATDIARILTLVEGIDAAAVDNVVYATATAAGVAGNSFTLSAFGDGLTVAGATFSGGRDNAYVRVNGITLTQGTDWTAASTASGTAKAISDAMMDRVAIAELITSTWTDGGVVTATSIVVGADKNLSLAASPSASLSVSGVTMTGGQDAAYALNSGTIRKQDHGLSTGLQVLYTTGSAVGLSPLAWGTTYFSIRVDDDNFRLATTSTGSIAGDFVTLTSSSTTGPNTFTVTPLPIAGTFGFKWQASNDNANWVDLNVSSITFASPYAAGSTLWDFETVNYRYLRVNTTAGTAGALRLQVIGNGKTGR